MNETHRVTCLAAKYRVMHNISCLTADSALDHDNDDDIIPFERQTSVVA